MTLADVIHRAKAHTAPKLLRGHNGGLTFVAFLSDDNIISASDEDKTIRRWRLSDGRKNEPEVVLAPVACAIATSPNGRWLAMGGKDGKVRLLDLETPKAEIVKSTEKHAEVVTSLSFSSDSSQLASGAQNGTIRVWSLTSAALVPLAGPLKGHTDSLWRVSYAPDGKKIASSDREIIKIWHGTTSLGMTIYEQAWSLAWSLDSNILFAGCIDGSVRFYNPETGALHVTYNAHTDVVYSIALSRNAKFIATASWDKTVCLWDTATFQQVGPSLQHDGNVHSISISPDDSHLVSGAREPNIRVWNLGTVAPDLFKETVLKPNRAPQANGLYISLPAWRLRPARSPSDVPTPRGFLIPDPHNEFPEHSDSSSTKSKGSKRRGFLGSLRRNRGKSDGGEIVNPSTHNGNHTEDTSDHSNHHPANGISIMRPLRILPEAGSSSSSQRPVVNLSSSPSSSQSWKSHNESEAVNLIQEIRSYPNHDLTAHIVPQGDHPVSGGSQGDIYRGILSMNGKDMQVAIKVIKRYLAQGDDYSKRRRLRREIKLWLKLEHRNVIPLLGTTQSYGEFPAMVCPWVENGSLTSHMERHHKDLNQHMRFGIINDVALGLQYLHSQSVIHGDISGSNILIYRSGRACIADFGLSFVEYEFQGSSMALTYQVKGTLRWTAPELLSLHVRERPEDENRPEVIPTVQSDIYSFAGIMLHVLSGKVPYYDHPGDAAVIVAISRGEFPRRPSLTPTVTVTDDQWDFMMACWSSVPSERPSDLDVVGFVHEQLLNAVAAAPAGNDLRYGR